MKYLCVNNKKALFISVHILLLFIYLWFYESNPNSISSNLKMMGVFGWAQFVISVVGWKRITGRVFVPYIIFLLAAYIFCVGQSFLEVFNLVVEERSVYNMCSASEIYRAEVYSLLFLASFHIGALVDYRKKYSETKINDSSKTKLVEYSAIKNIGRIYIYISFIPFIIENYVKYSMVSAYGYWGLYKNTGIPLWGLITLLSDFFIPGVLCILLTSRPNSNRQRSILLFFAAIIFFIMYCGGRSQGVVLVAVTLLYYQNHVKAISKKGWILLCVGGFFFVYMMSVISHLRSGSRDSYVEAIVNYKAEAGSNPFFETISEMGGSIYPMARTMTLVPSTNEEYRYGTTYLYALSSLIPNVGFWERHPAAVKANLAEWLMKKDRLTYSPAYSIVAEAYINFGIAGFIVMFILGVYFSRVLNIESGSKNKMLTFLVAIIFTYMSLQMVRNCFFGVVRTIAYYILPIYWYVSYRINKTKKIRTI